MKLFKYIFFLILCSVAPAYGYFYNLSVWRTFDSALQTHAYAAVCYDIHNYSQVLNQEQINTVKHIVPTCTNMHLLIEDQPREAQQYRDLGLYNTVAELKEICSTVGCTVESVEYRFKKTDSVYKCMRALSFTNEQQFAELDEKLQQLGYTTKAIAQEFFDSLNYAQHMINECELDGQLIQKMAHILRAALQQIEQQWTSELAAWQQFDGTLLLYMRAHNCLNQEYLAQVSTFDRGLFDIRIFLQLLKAQTEGKFVVMAAGGAHCITIEHFLHSAGYTKLYQYDSDIDIIKDTIAIPDTITAAQQTKYLMTANTLFTQSGVQLNPVPAGAFVSFDQPAAYAQHASWWTLFKEYIRNSLR